MIKFAPVFASGISVLALLLGQTVRAEDLGAQGVHRLYEKSYVAAFGIALTGRFDLTVLERQVGTECSVRMTPELSDANADRVRASQQFPWTASLQLPLTQVRAQWVGEQLRLHMTFERPVTCTFQLSADQHSVWVAVETDDPEQGRQMQALMQEAATHLANGDTDRAIEGYRQVLKFPPHPVQQEALEYLGVALERKQSFDAASQVYQDYLQKYPESFGSKRVQQRLDGLRLMNANVQAPLHKARKDKSDQASMRWSGVLSNAFQQYSSDQALSEWTSLQSAWLTDAQVHGRYRDGDYDVKMLFSGGFWKDFEQETTDLGRLRKAYVDVYHQDSGQQFRLGRQTTSGEGVLGRYDGLHYRKELSPRYALNGFIGAPNASSRDLNPDTDARLYGVNLDLMAPGSPWRGNVFASQQTRDGLVDRQALGSELNYLSPSYTLLGYLDYDVHFNELNTVMANANWFGAEELHYYVSLDYRRSPTLTLSNTLIGQTLTELGQLADSGLSESELEEVALDRSAISKTFSLGASRRFHPQYRWGVDASVWKLSGTSTSLGVPGFDGTDLESNLRLQLLGNDLVWHRDLAWFTLRLADLTSSRLVALTTDWRIPVNQQWRLRPKLQVYQRNFVESDQTTRSLQPRLRVEYQPARDWHLEMDVGAEWLTTEQGALDLTQFGVLTYLRADWQF